MDTEKNHEVEVVLCTCPPEEATQIARALLERRLAACVNVIPGVRSLYWWKGEVAEDGEALLVIKTGQACLQPLADALEELHPYDLPEFLCLQPDSGSQAYLRWVQEALRG